eukprot:2739637-Rhodomonas_salina.1
MWFDSAAPLLAIALRAVRYWHARAHITCAAYCATRSLCAVRYRRALQWRCCCPQAKPHRFGDHTAGLART